MCDTLYLCIAVDFGIFYFFAGINKPNIFVLPTKLQGGEYYTLVLTGRTYSAEIGQASFPFVANLPPYGGYCSIFPPIGLY